MKLAFTVWGHAATKGAVRPIPIKKAGVVVGSRLTEDSKRSRPWQSLVRDAARQAIGSSTIPFAADQPVRLRAVIWLPAPKSLPKRRASAPVNMRAGDADKLARGLLDSLINCAFVDDGQVVELCVLKCYVKPGSMPHVDIVVDGVDLAAWPWKESQALAAKAGELFAPHAEIVVEGV